MAKQQGNLLLHEKSSSFLEVLLFIYIQQVVTFWKSKVDPKVSPKYDTSFPMTFEYACISLDEGSHVSGSGGLGTK